MKISKLIIYAGGWLIHILFSMTLFPVLSITVMLPSIFLAMLGAWLFRFRGAIFTTILCIAYHYLMLEYHSDNPTVVAEAWNVFGISLQLTFSMLTATLKSSQERYQKLNKSLKKIVDERTSELRSLNNYLMDLGDIERANTIKTLLNIPMKELNQVLRTSTLLELHLERTKHPSLEKARTIALLARNCLAQMKSLGNSSLYASEGDFDIEPALNQLTSHLRDLSGVDIRMISDCNWERLPPHMATHIYHIVHEALTNALRHADPSTVEIGLINAPEKCTVYIENDGQPLQNENRKGMGISLMRHRAMRLEGTLSILGGPGKNTRVQCVIPHSG